MLLAALVALFCLKRRRRPRPEYAMAPAYELKDQSPVSGKYAASEAFSVPADSAAAIVESNLSQPVEDNALSSGLSTIKTQINNHVLSFYNNAPGRETPPLQDITQALGSNAPVSASKLQSLLADSSTRSAAMKFALAWIITSRISPDSDLSTTFLPQKLMETFQDMSRANMTERSRCSRLGVECQLTQDRS